MANPAIIDCTADTWVLAAVNVITGIIHRKKSGTYLQTYRLTGEDAPTDILDGAALFENSTSEPISSTENIDVYVMAIGADGQVIAGV